MSKRFDVIANETVEKAGQAANSNGGCDGALAGTNAHSVHHVDRRTVHKSPHVFRRHLHQSLARL